MLNYTTAEQILVSQMESVARDARRALNQREFMAQIHGLVEEFHERGKPSLQELLDMDDTATEDTEAEQESQYHLTLEPGYSGPTIRMTLTEGQSISLIKPLLHALVRTRLFHPAVYCEGTTSVSWTFRTKEAHRDSDYLTTRTVYVSVVFADSQTCRAEPTGNMIPETKVVCDDGHHYDTPDADVARYVDDLEG